MQGLFDSTFHNFSKMAQITPNFFQNNQSYVKIDSECFSGESNQDIPYPPSQGPSKASKHSQNLPTACGKFLNGERAHLDPVFTRYFGAIPEKSQKVLKTLTSDSTPLPIDMGSLACAVAPPVGVKQDHLDLGTTGQGPLYTIHPNSSVSCNIMYSTQVTGQSVTACPSRASLEYNDNRPAGPLEYRPTGRRFAASVTQGEYELEQAVNYRQAVEYHQDYELKQVTEYPKDYELKHAVVGGKFPKVSSTGSGVGEAMGLGENFVKSGPFVPYFSTSPGQETPLLPASREALGEEEVSCAAWTIP